MRYQNNLFGKFAKFLNINLNIVKFAFKTR